MEVQRSAINMSPARWTGVDHDGSGAILFHSQKHEFATVYYSVNAQTRRRRSCYDSKRVAYQHTIVSFALPCLNCTQCTQAWNGA